jgi:hypothetical protein
MSYPTSYRSIDIGGLSALDEKADDIADLTHAFLVRIVRQIA